MAITVGAGLPAIERKALATQATPDVQGLKKREGTTRKWQGRLDSNQRMAGSKPAALPLGDAPVAVAMSAWHSLAMMQRGAT